MNIAPVSIRALLMALIRPMPMKAPRQEASATASSERAEPCGGREGERDINYVPMLLVMCALQPSCPSLSVVNDEAVERIDWIDVAYLARVDQRIVRVRQILRQLLQLAGIGELVLAVRPAALEEMLQLLQRIARGGRGVTFDHALHQLL